MRVVQLSPHNHLSAKMKKMLEANKPVWSSGVRKRAGFSLKEPRLGIRLIPAEGRRCGVAVPEAVGDALVEAPGIQQKAEDG